MLNIEDLIRQIIASPLFKDELHSQIKSCTENRDEPAHSISSSLTLPGLVEEINCYITEITEIALEEENSKNYIMFMKKNEELCNELEKKVNAKIQSSVLELDAKIQAISLKFNELSKTAKKVGAEGCKLKDERKLITQSILETSRLQNSSNAFSIIQTKSQVHFVKDPNSYQQLGESNDTNSSLSLELEKVKFAEIEKECKKCLQAWWIKVEGALEGFKKSQEKLKQQHQLLSERMQAKLQGNLQSLWNVISDLCSRISKFQSMQHLLPQMET